tara:strand:+ start:1593 stop:1709 length:117 start_codon:yes stop_codon:yes gene_type:complete
MKDLQAYLFIALAIVASLVALVGVIELAYIFIFSKDED